MKKIKWSLFFVLSIILLITVSNVSALFDNGSFETGDFTSWTKETFSNPGLMWIRTFHQRKYCKKSWWIGPELCPLWRYPIIPI